MLKQSGSRLTMAVLAAALVVIIAGGVATASNMAFKMNRAFLGIGGVAPSGDNWTSIPYINPYTSINSFCTQIGLVSTGLGARGRITVVDQTTGSPAQINCGTTAGNAALPSDGRGVALRQVAGGPTSGIIVGSHDPAKLITIPDQGVIPAGSFWFSVPYHTTAVTANDLCASSGLTNSGLGSRAQITRVDGLTGTPTSANCGTTAGNSLNLVLGEAVRILEPNGPKTFRPAHF